VRAPYILLTPATAIKTETVKTTRYVHYATSFRAPAWVVLGQGVGPRVTIARKVRAQHVSSAKIRWFAQAASLAMPPPRWRPRPPPPSSLSVPSGLAVWSPCRSGGRRG
jgi:hypothetical protein